MFEKRKAKKNVDRVFQLAAETATLPMPVPTYVQAVEVELLFFFFFLLDYREFHKEEREVREKTLDEFVKRVGKELGIRAGEKAAYAVYEKRIMAFHQLLQRASKVGDFLEPASEYIEAMALHLQEEGRFSGAGPDQLESARQRVPQGRLGTLAEPIAMSISMNAQSLL